MIDPDIATRLSRSDQTLGRIIQRVGPCTLAPRKGYFAALCRAIIAQQLSTTAAATIQERFRCLFPGRRVTPASLLARTDADLRAVGLSRQKTAYLRDLAAKLGDGTIPCRRLSRMEDDQIIAALTQVRGIGVWTVQMFLIFVLNRPDVLPTDDLGLRKAVQTHYGGKTLPTAARLSELAEPWRPYRSFATWYLWQSLKNQPIKRTRRRERQSGPRR
jgi:DNA-3-methyladenine glycosylase II